MCVCAVVVVQVSLQVELDSLVHEHNRVVSNLKQEITQLQVLCIFILWPILLQ